MKNLSWTSDVSFATCNDLKSFLLKQGSNTGPVHLGLSAMERLDVAGLQVLLSTRLWLQGSNGDLVLTDNAQAKRVNALCKALGAPEFPLEADSHA